MRRLLNVAAGLSLLVTMALLATGTMELPRWPMTIHPTADGLSLTLLAGRATVERYSGGAFAAVPVSLPFVPLSIPFALFPLVWFVRVRQQSRQRRARGFPVEVVAPQK